MPLSLKHLFTPSRAQQAHEAYLRVVAQARSPFFYRDWQIEDSLDGRFDVLVLHLFLVLSRCADEAVFCRALTEVFFADMDRSLREMGAGDTGVAKRVQAMAQAFYGRMEAYRQVPDDDALADALRRNVWREKTAGDAAALAAYMRRNQKALQAQPVVGLVQGHITFSD